jgi:hypothetical protein
VVTKREKMEAEWLTVADPRPNLQYVSGATIAETYDESQRAAAEHGFSEEELAKDPSIAAGKIITSYYPEFLLRDLRQQHYTTANERDRKQIGWQIEAVEKAIERTKTWPMQPITALWVSIDADEKKTMSVPLKLYIAPDPEAPLAFPYALRIWDFTIPGQAQEYTNGHGATTPLDALHEVLEAFAEETPYTVGTVRFSLDSTLLPESFAVTLPIPRKKLELHTQGGTRFERWFAQPLFYGALFAVGAATLGVGAAAIAFAIHGAITDLANIINRLQEGTFELDLQTGLDILAIAGGIIPVAAPVISSVRGFGSVAWLGRTTHVVDVLQVGVSVGTHLDKIIAAYKSGEREKILDAWMGAFTEGAVSTSHHARSAKGFERDG